MINKFCNVKIVYTPNVVVCIRTYEYCSHSNRHKLITNIVCFATTNMYVFPMDERQAHFAPMQRTSLILNNNHTDVCWLYNMFIISSTSRYIWTEFSLGFIMNTEIHIFTRISCMHARSFTLLLSVLDIHKKKKENPQTAHEVTYNLRIITNNNISYSENLCFNWSHIKYSLTTLQLQHNTKTPWCWSDKHVPHFVRALF